MTPDDLDLVETGLLVDALERRSKSLLLIMEVPVKTNAAQHRNAFYFNGGWISALGLATHAVDRVKECRLERLTDEKEGT